MSMKNIIKVLVLVFLINACTKTKNNDYLTFSGKIENRTSDSIVLKSFYEMRQKVVKLAPDGSFKDTLKVIDGYYGLYIGKRFKKVYFQNGDDINMTVDYTNFSNTLNFTGKGVEEINLMRKDYDARRKLYEEDSIMDLPEIDFNRKVSSYYSRFNELLKDKTLDSTFVISHRITMDGIKKNIQKSYQENLYLKNNLVKGKPSPKFINYTNHKGGTASLDDLKGKYVYLDFWEIGCKPCIAQFPALDELREKYKNKNIEFVYISLERKKHFDEWKNYVTDNKLKGLQLFNDEKSDFRDAYKITSIPRYILIDPEGNIVDAQTYKPSDPKLTELLDSLDI